MRVTDAMRDRLERMRDLARTHAKMTNPPVSHEFQADADALEAALSASPATVEPVAEMKPGVFRLTEADQSELVTTDEAHIYDNHYSLARVIRSMTTREIVGFAWDGIGDPPASPTAAPAHEGKPYCYVLDVPDFMGDMNNPPEQGYTDFSDVPKPGYEPLYKHPPIASPPSMREGLEAAAHEALAAFDKSDVPVKWHSFANLCEAMGKLRRALSGEQHD